jgi:hypothetical protein
VRRSAFRDMASGEGRFLMNVSGVGRFGGFSR